ncbi:MAG: hypothetical protein ABGU93_13815 [Acetobacterium sp.]
MSEYDGSEGKSLIQVHLKINVPIYFFMGRSPKRRRSAAKTELHGFIQWQ